VYLRALADLVVLAHLGFVIFAALGGLLALRWCSITWLRLSAPEPAPALRAAAPGAAAQGRRRVVPWRTASSGTSTVHARAPLSIRHGPTVRAGWCTSFA